MEFASTGFASNLLAKQECPTTLRSHRINTARLSFNPAAPRIGRVQRQCQRCLIAHNGAANPLYIMRGQCDFITDNGSHGDRATK